jgi:hypothetical protein
MSEKKTKLSVILIKFRNISEQKLTEHIQCCNYLYSPPDDGLTSQKKHVQYMTNYTTTDTTFRTTTVSIHRIILAGTNLGKHKLHSVNCERI